MVVSTVRRSLALILAGTCAWTLSAGTASAGGSWSHPPLRLAVAHVDGKVFVGAQAWMSDGCEHLVGSTKGRAIRIRGSYESNRAGYGCTAAVWADWEAVRVPRGERTIVRVRYRGKVGRYAVRVSNEGVTTHFRSGRNISRPASNKWWWVPHDALIANVSGRNDEAVQRGSAYLDARLREEGAVTFEPPPGWVIVSVYNRGNAPGDRGEYMADEYQEDLEGDYQRRIYRADMSRRKLQRLANETAGTERCIHVAFYREALSSNGAVHDEVDCRRS